MLHNTHSPVPSLLFFGGPYGNLQALTALRVVAEELGLPQSSIVCTGDTVAYCAQPYETVEEIRRWRVQVVAGNVEIQLANDAGDCGCNFIEGSVCDRLSEQWYAFANSRITGEQRAWMRLLPTTLTLQIGSRKIGVVHGSRANVSEFLFRSSPWEKKLPNFASLECDDVVGGHCGIPFIERRRDKLWVNAGVIGMPANFVQPLDPQHVASLANGRAIPAPERQFAVLHVEVWELRRWMILLALPLRIYLKWKVKTEVRRMGEFVARERGRPSGEGVGFRMSSAKITWVSKKREGKTT